jgi:transcriptional regulator with XRE-family HTH domain
LSTLSKLHAKLASGRRYREAFVSSQLKRGIPFQVRALRKQRDWSQERLAQEANLTQGVISRAEDPDYGNLTLNTLLRIAAGFDVAFAGKFVPFSELGRWFLNQSETTVQVPSFDDDVTFIERKEPQSEQLNLPGWNQSTGTQPGEVRPLYGDTPSGTFRAGSTPGLLAPSGTVAPGSMAAFLEPFASVPGPVGLEVLGLYVSAVRGQQRTGAPDQTAIAATKPWIAGTSPQMTIKQQPPA